MRQQRGVQLGAAVLCSSFSPASWLYSPSPSLCSSSSRSVCVFLGECMLFGISDSVHPNLANEMYCCFVPLLSSVYNKLVIFFVEGKKVTDLYHPFW